MLILETATISADGGSHATQDHHFSAICHLRFLLELPACTEGLGGAPVTKVETTVPDHVTLLPSPILSIAHHEFANRVSYDEPL
jgi:hypothetical protein